VPASSEPILKASQPTSHPPANVISEAGPSQPRRRSSRSRQRDLFSPDPSVPVASGTIVIPSVADRGRKVATKVISDSKQPARKRSVSIGKGKKKEAASVQQPVEKGAEVEAEGKGKERETEQEPVSYLLCFQVGIITDNTIL